MEVLRNGKFSLPISSERLSKGLRKTEKIVNNSYSLSTCSGVIGKEGKLSKLSDLIRSFDISTSFPYPQIFVETNIIIVCTQTQIYEVVEDNPELRLTVAGGSTWSLVSSHDFIYMSNGIVSVIRDPNSHVFSESDDLPTAHCMCNYNGQIIIGAPDAGYEI